MTSLAKSSEKFDQDSRKFHYCPRKKYEITITLKDKYQNLVTNNSIRSDLDKGIDFKYDPYARLINHQRWFQQDVIPLLNMHSEYKLYLELSDPQVLDDKCWPRIHYHGYIRFKNNESLLLWKLNTAPELAQFGRIQLNEFRHEYWMDYCKKDKDKTHNLFRLRKIQPYYQYPSMKKKFFR